MGISDVFAKCLLCLMCGEITCKQFDCIKITIQDFLLFLCCFFMQSLLNINKSKLKLFKFKLTNVNY